MPWSRPARCADAVVPLTAGDEVILNNIARMSPPIDHGRASAAGTPTASCTKSRAQLKEKTAQEMILFAPRKVTLPPNQPQAVRLSARAPEGLPDGEYRVHMLFRAIPDARPQVAEPKKVEGVAFQLRPIYGITIPVIVRLGNLEATAALSNVRKITDNGKPAIALDINRTGDRSTFGEVRVFKAGIADPIAIVAGSLSIPKSASARSSSRSTRQSRQSTAR